MLILKVVLMVFGFAQSIYSMEENYIRPSIIVPHNSILKYSEFDKCNSTWNIVFLEQISIGEVKQYPGDYNLILCRQGLKDNGRLSDQWTWANFSRCLLYDQKPIVKNNAIVFYACGYNVKFNYNTKAQLPDKRLEEEVFEYSFLFATSKTPNLKKQKICRIALGNEKDSSICSMIHFFDFPVLLEAILASSYKDEKRCNVEGSTLLYFLSGVTLPAHYRYCCKETNSFEKLPGYIKDQIIKHYEKQQNIQ